MGDFYVKKKIIINVLLLLIISVTFLGCGDSAVDKVALVDVTTEEGITLKLPDDMVKQEGNITSYVNKETGDNVSFGLSEVDMYPISSWGEEDVLALYQSKYEDVLLKSFENGKEINGKDAIVSVLDIVTPGNNNITLTLVVVTDGAYDYVISYIHGKDNTEGSLASNIETSIESINITK